MLAIIALVILVIAVGVTFASFWYPVFKPYLLPIWAAMLVCFFGAKRLQKLERRTQR